MSILPAAAVDGCNHTPLSNPACCCPCPMRLQLAAITALRDEGVVYVDTTSSFSAERLLAIAAAHAGPEAVRCSSTQSARHRQAVVPLQSDAFQSRKRVEPPALAGVQGGHHT